MDSGNLQAKLFKALSHPIRLKIVKSLIRQDRCVCELNEEIEFSQSNLSQHLKLLKDAGIVESHKEGLKVNYRLYHPKIAELIRLSEEVVRENLEKLL